MPVSLSGLANGGEHHVLIDSAFDDAFVNPIPATSTFSETSALCLKLNAAAINCKSTVAFLFVIPAGNLLFASRLLRTRYLSLRL
jgi:hypothetical protein